MASSHKFRLRAAVLVGLLALTTGLRPADAAPVSVLETVRERGYINCGVSDGTVGFSQVDSQGRWSGLEVEFCSALAAAVFGDKNKVKYRALQSADRYKALQDREVDVLLRTTAWTLSRDTDLGLRFVAVLFYDGQGFLVPRTHVVTSVLELSGASICVLPGGSGERTVSEFFTRTNMRYQLVTSPRWEDLVRTYGAGGCTVLTGDMSSLAIERSRLVKPDDHGLLPELISKEPLGPLVLADDDRWFEVVRWTVMALVAAEEHGVGRANIAAMENSNMIDVRRLLGLESNLGQPLGLARDWALQIVRQVGNYGEIFDRTVGKDSILKLERGLNNLWTKGGLMYAAPFR